MNYYPFHIGDYISHTSHLSDAEDLAYRRLIDLYYQTEKPFKHNLNWLSRKIKSTPEIVDLILNEFFEFENDQWHSKRADEEISKYQAKADSARNANRIKSAKISSLKSELKSEPLQIVTNNQEPITINHKPITNIKPLSDFDLFWMAYPKKVGKEAARKSWDKVKPDLKTVLETLKWQKQSDQWFKNNGQYIPNPSTYLNQHRFLDQRNDNREAF